MSLAEAFSVVVECRQGTAGALREVRVSFLCRSIGKWQGWPWLQGWHMAVNCLQHFLDISLCRNRTNCDVVLVTGMEMSWAF